MTFTIHAFVGQKLGSRKDPAKAACNDVIYCRNAPDFFFYGLADGQSAKRFSKMGGTVTLHAVASYIEETGFSKILNSSFQDEIPFLLTRAYRNALCILAQQQGCPLTEYASTVLGIAIHRESGDYMVLHLGDGCAIGVLNNRAPMIISPPDNYYSSEYTWLTTSNCAAHRLRISIGNIRNFQRLILLTDGARSLCRGKNISAGNKRILADKDAHEIIESLKNSNPRDDASCIVLDVHHLSALYDVQESEEI